MDVLVKSVDSPHAAIICYREFVEILRRIGFTLKYWASNCPKVLEVIPIDDQLEANELTLNADSSPISGLDRIIDQASLQDAVDLIKSVHQMIRNVLSYLLNPPFLIQWKSSHPSPCK